MKHKSDASTLSSTPPPPSSSSSSASVNHDEISFSNIESIDYGNDDGGITKLLLQYKDCNTIETPDSHKIFDPIWEFLQTKENGNLGYIKEYIKSIDQFDVNSELGVYKLTMLHVACMYGNMETIRYILHELHADISTKNKDGQNALFFATKHGNATTVSYLLSYDVSIINSTQKNGSTALHVACFTGSIDVIKILLDTKGIDTELLQNDGLTALQIAVRNNHYDVVHYLVTHGITDNIVTPHYKQTALHMAAQDGYLTIVQCLIQDGSANIDLLDAMGWKALHFATRHGHFEVVQYLLTVTVNCDNTSITDLTKNYLTVLELASIHGHCEIFAYILPLLQHSAQEIAPIAEVIRINCGGETYTDVHDNVWEADDRNKYYSGGNIGFDSNPTSKNTLISTERNGTTFAYTIPIATNGWYDVVLHFSEFHWNEANKRVFDVHINGRTVAKDVDVWCKSGGKNILIMETYETYVYNEELSIEFKTKIENAKISAIEIAPTKVQLYKMIEEQKLEALRYTCQYGHFENLQKYIQSYCIDAKNSIDTITEGISVAIQYDQVEVVELLLTQFKNYNKLKCLQRSSNYGSLKSAKYLMTFVVDDDMYGIDEHDNFDRLTALHDASRNGHVDVVKCLVKDGGADIEVESSNGCTALHLAARFGQLAIVQYLLTVTVSQKRSFVNAVSNNGLTALHYATMNGYYDVVRYLLTDGRANPCLTTKYGLPGNCIAYCR